MSQFQPTSLHVGRAIARRSCLFLSVHQPPDESTRQRQDKTNPVGRAIARRSCLFPSSHQPPDEASPGSRVSDREQDKNALSVLTCQLGIAPSRHQPPNRSFA